MNLFFSLFFLGFLNIILILILFSCINCEEKSIEKCFDGYQYKFNSKNITSEQFALVLSAVFPDAVAIKYDNLNAYLFLNDKIKKEIFDQKFGRLIYNVEIINLLITEKEHYSIRNLIFKYKINTTIDINIKQFFTEEKCKLYIPSYIPKNINDNTELINLLNELKNEIKKIELPSNENVINLLNELKTQINKIEIPSNTEIINLLKDIKLINSKITINSEISKILNDIKEITSNEKSTLILEQMSNNLREAKITLTTINSLIEKLNIKDNSIILNDINKSLISIKDINTKSETFFEKIFRLIETSQGYLNTISGIVTQGKGIATSVRNIYQGTFEIYQYLVAGGITAGMICSGIGERLTRFRPSLPPFSEANYLFTEPNSLKTPLIEYTPIIQNDIDSLVELIANCSKEEFDSIFQQAPHPSVWFNADAETYGLYMRHEDRNNFNELTFGRDWNFDSGTFEKEWKTAMNLNSYKYILITMQLDGKDDDGEQVGMHPTIPKKLVPGKTNTVYYAYFASKFFPFVKTSINIYPYCDENEEHGSDDICGVFKQLIVNKKQLKEYYVKQNIECYK